MDQFSTLRGILDVRWDAPYRFIASLIALVTIAGAAVSRTPIGAMASGASWAGWSDAVTVLGQVEVWLGERTLVLIAPGALLLVAGSVFAYRRGRGASTALIGSAMLVQAGERWNLFPMVVFGVMLLLWLVARLFANRAFDIFEDPTRQIGSGVTAIAGALFWVLLGPVAWMVRRG